MSEDGPLEAGPPKDGALFRGVIGAAALIGGLIGFFLLYFVPIPDGNRDALMLALGLVLGWGGTIISFEFGSSPSGRKAADAGIKK